ncbi:MAG: COQ9 family protein [Pseudomonadota bacterium]
MNDKRTEEDHIQAARETLLKAALPEIGFDGWSTKTLQAAIAETGTDSGLARLAFPRGPMDMVLGFHRMADHWLDEDLDGHDLESMRIRERVTFCVRRRIELIAPHREAVRRGVSFMALPPNAPEGAKALWQTADLIWRRCGDTATDYNWYTKRAILSGVYSSTVLYWLGDQDPRAESTWEFLDRRIEGIMRFEKTKASLKNNPLARAALWGPMQVLGMLKAPGASQDHPRA